MEKVIQTTENSHASDILVHLNELRKNRQYCDFTIKCDGMEIQVHKCVISSGSGYFRVMLSHDMIENHSGVVEMKDINPKCLEKCVEFMYTGEITVSSSMAVEMIHVALILQIPNLNRGIAEVMATDLDVSSFLLTMEVAVFFGLKDLERTCNEFATNNLHSVMKMDYFKEFEADYLQTLLDSTHMLDVVKCKAILTWAHDDFERSESLACLFNLIDVNNLPLSYRKFLLEETVVSNSPECTEYISKSMPEKLQVNSIEYMGDCNPGIIMMNKASRRLERYDLVKNSWIGMHLLTDDMASGESSMVIVNQHLYFYKWQQALFRIDFTDSEATWESLKTPMYEFGGSIAHFDGVLYVSNADTINIFLAAYTIKDNHWFFTAPKRFCTSGSSITVARGLLFVIGGNLSFNRVENFAGVECFDPKSLSWQSHIYNLNIARSDAPVCSRDDVIYVFGGTCDCPNTMEILYQHSSSWELVKLENFGRYRSLSHNIEGKIFIVGGDDGMESIQMELDTDSVAVFDPNTCTVSLAFFFSGKDFDTHYGFQLSAAVIM